ncbi:glutamate receptor 2-like [Nasonia vitripennis]|uniref:Ionotropic glutamate receptor C-terminal domain-containing protein n=1 Tax=Nasonia vitripennis TaxID=7425 RepID=A0A7M7INL4_NASVI|nr:glutamate receptor 2-like [Nasonia vitripennis]
MQRCDSRQASTPYYNSTFSRGLRLQLKLELRCRTMFSFLAFLSILKIAQAVEGVIWSKSARNFVPLFSISRFAVLNDERIQRSKDLEWHDFQHEILKVAYYQERNLVSFIENDTRISGVVGEVWEILANYLNFTLVPVRLQERNFGNELENGSYDGILGLIQSNQSQIIPRSGIFRNRLSLVDYTVPLWNIRYHLYIKPEWSHDDAWMFHLFSLKVWYTFILFLVVLSIAGYICEKNSFMKTNEKIIYNLQDHIFYTAAIACNQGCVPAELHNRSRLIYICTSMFSWVILIAFSSNAIFLMMNKKFILPFTGLRSLIQDSKYEVVAFSGSMVHKDFKETVSKYYKYSRDIKRVSYAPAAGEIFRKVCFTEDKKLAAFEAEDRHKAIGKNICRLISTKASYFETWIASAIKRGFRYKRSFDIGILKLSEFGIIDGLRDRWLDWKFDDHEEIPFQSIDMSQVHLIFSILVLGLIMSLLILLLEYLTYFRGRLFVKKKSKPNIPKVTVKPKLPEIDRNRVFHVYR